MQTQLVSRDRSLQLLNNVNSTNESPIIMRLVITPYYERQTGTNKAETNIAKKKTETDSIVEGLNLIKEKLGLSKVELAKISGIPRATLYKVLENKLAAEDKHVRVRDLADIVRKEFNNGIENRVALKSFYIEGKNLIQLLSAEDLNHNLIGALAEQIKIELSKRSKSINKKMEKVQANSNLDPEFDSNWASFDS